MREKYTGLLLQKRLLNEDDIDIHTAAREFIPIEKLDQTMPQIGGVKAFFTIGVVVDVSGPFQSKSGKQFSTLKLSDLVKYDLNKVRKLLETIAKSQYSGNQEGAQEFVKLSEKSFNSNGYKTLKIMAFQEAATPIAKLNVGTIVGLLNPKVMRTQPGL